MASVDNNQNPWAPYDNYKDCSSEICSIYCPQYCYLIFPPPPLSDDDSGTPFSPLIIAIIGVLASAFILVCYYTIATRYWRRRNIHDSSAVNDEYHSEFSREQQQQTLSAGLDEELIKNITVCNYRKGEGLIEGSECVVCLSEFQENESVRLLPKCDHAFHLPCIDTWLRSHSNCPLCRANVIVLAHPTPVSQSSSVINMNSYEIHRPDDLILVVDDRESNCDERVVLENDQEGVDEVRRSMSVGAFSCQRELMVSDILKIEETDEDLLVENVRTRRGVGSSMGLLRSPVAAERYVFNSPFMFMVHDNGKNSMHQN